jgi:iron uptake system component EfeO
LLFSNPNIDLKGGRTSMATHPGRLGRTTTLVGVGGLCLALVAGACGGSDEDSSNPAKAGGHTAHVTVTAAKGCEIDATSFRAGGLTFAITNEDATGVTEVELLGGQRILAEKENLPPGFSGSFSVNVEAGTYDLYCPGAKDEHTAITVTGTGGGGADESLDQLLQDGVHQYKEYVETQVTELVEASEALQRALHGSDLSAAQIAYIKARPFYEKIEPVAESFTVGDQNLDADIDGRADDVAAADFKGFHRIEKGLFADQRLDGLGAYGDELVTNVKQLASLTEDLTYKPFELANGAQELLDEVASTKLTGEEERYSHIDLLDFDSNDEAAAQAFACLKPALEKIDPALAGQIADAFTALDRLVDTFRTGDNPSGFVLYDSVTPADQQRFAAAVKAVQEPLSKVASKVANA